VGGRNVVSLLLLGQSCAKTDALTEAASSIAQVYFPDSASLNDADVDHIGELSIVGQYALADEMVHYVELNDGRAFYFQSRKEPADPVHHLDQFSLGFEHLASRLPGFVTSAVRGIWYDDKHSSYLWRVDLSYGVGFSPDIRILRDRLSEVLVEPGELGGQFHDFEFRSVAADETAPETPRTQYESDLQLFANWPDEPPE
jgi:hypothetical protein